MQKASADGWRAPRTSFFRGAVAAGALIAAGCNAVLGIEPAKLEPDASMGGEEEAGSTCSELGVSPCASCVASHCCEQYQACTADPECKTALDVYNGCVTRPPIDAGTSTCSEDLGTNANARAQALAECMFVNFASGGPTAGACADTCQNAPIGDDACANYCGCMADFCQMTIPADCPAACSALNRLQLHCRTYHCFLASREGPTIHCQHAIGLLGKCP